MFECQIHFYTYKQFNFQHQFSISAQFSVYTRFDVKTVLFQTIQFNTSTLFSSIWPMDRTLLDVTTPGQSGSGNDGNEGVLCIPQSSSITEASLSDCLVSYPRHSLWVGSCPSSEKQSAYFTAPADWAITKGLVQGLEDLEIRDRVENIRTTALLRSVRIPRRVRETWGDLFSLKHQWETIS